MVIMNLELENILGFPNFKMNFSYPKKIVSSIIEGEHLAGRPNFRYKKAIVLMGANAAGKTSIGKILMKIFPLSTLEIRAFSLRSFQKEMQVRSVSIL